MIVKLVDPVMLLGTNFDRVLFDMNNTNIDEWKQLISLISRISDNTGVKNERISSKYSYVQILIRGVFLEGQLIRITGLMIKYN